MPSTEQRDLRTLLRESHQLVKMRARLQHTLQAIALNHALRQGRALWSAAGKAHCRHCLCRPIPIRDGQHYRGCMYSCRNESRNWIKKWKPKPGQRPQARRLLTHPGVGPVTALATEVFLGDPSRFATGNQVASSIGMIPCEHSSGKRQLSGKTDQARQLTAALFVDRSYPARGAERSGS